MHVIPDVEPATDDHVPALHWMQEELDDPAIVVDHVPVLHTLHVVTEVAPINDDHEPMLH